MAVSLRRFATKERVLVLAIGLAVVAAAVGATQLLPSLCYAAEKAEARAAQEHLAKLEQASTAFRLVAKALRPSVVSIRATKILRAAEAPQFRHPFGDDPFMRRFFGDDFFERFFGNQPHGGQQFRQSGIGTGVVVDAKGYVLTNNHVVADADEVVVQLSDKREFRISRDEIDKRVFTDPKSDLAVLKIDAKDLAPAKLGDSDKLEVGDWVVAIGNPFGLELTVTAGICSAKGRALANLAEYQDFIQTDAAINPGNSGGPLVNLRGEVIGINTAIFSRSGGYMGIGFAIPMNMARTIMDRLIEHGKVERGQLGVFIQDLTPDLAKSFGLKETKGVVVPKVVPDSPADKAGVKTGDVILEVGGKAVKNAQQLKNRVASLPIGKEVDVVVQRNGKKLTLKATIAAQQEGATSGLDAYGFEVQDLTPELARRFGYQDAEGVVVGTVRPDSPADAAGLRPNDLIVAIQHRSVRNVAEFRQALQAADPSRGLLLLVRNQFGTRYLVLKGR